MSVNWESTTWGQPGSNVHVGSSAVVEALS